MGSIKEKIEQKRQDNIREENNRDNRRRNIFKLNTFSINERNNYRNRIDINRNNIRENNRNNNREDNRNNNRESNRNNNNNIGLDNHLHRLSYNRRHRNRIRDNENIDDLLRILEEEDEELNDRRNKICKEDAKEIRDLSLYQKSKKLKKKMVMN